MDKCSLFHHSSVSYKLYIYMMQQPNNVVCCFNGRRCRKRNIFSILVYGRNATLYSGTLFVGHSIAGWLCVYVEHDMVVCHHRSIRSLYTLSTSQFLERMSFVCYRGKIYQIMTNIFTSFENIFLIATIINNIKCKLCYVVINMILNISNLEHECTFCDFKLGIFIFICLRGK